ncbi:MAG: hypothetical protein QF473_04720 [Planctomycetota bacterium]|nr:hypothetical protein [Planctomycetota bacterium]MDP6502458.1 hypothetical protein [Planctomycetota bacterium]
MSWLDEFTGSPLHQIVNEIKSRNSLPALAPRMESDPALSERIRSLSPSEILGKPVAPSDFADSVKSALLLWNDALDESHTLSQGIGNTTGSYWHGIMHRREPDYSNSKYWFRKVGDHECFGAVREAAIRIFTEASSTWANETAEQLEASSAWDAFDFVDWCEGVDATGRVPEDARNALESLQAAEMEILLEYSAAKA